MSREHKLPTFQMSGIVISRRTSTKQKLSLDQKTTLTIDYTTMSESKSCSKQLRIYQPTYQLNPRKRFNVEVVEKILHRIVKSELENMEYSEKVVPDMCLTLTESIKAAIKEESYDRYRIIVAVTIGQRRQQSVHMFHSFLWDHDRDAFASHNFENCHIFANVVVYGVYFD